MKKVNLIVILPLSEDGLRKSANFFAEMEKIPEHLRSFLCYPTKKQWEAFLEGEEVDEIKKIRDNPYLVSFFEIRKDEKNEDILKKLNSIQGVKIFTQNIEKKVSVSYNWNTF